MKSQQDGITALSYTGRKKIVMHSPSSIFMNLFTFTEKSSTQISCYVSQ